MHAYIFRGMSPPGIEISSQARYNSRVISEERHEDKRLEKEIPYRSKERQT